MSTWDSAKLVTRIREVLEDARGTLRTIAAGTYAGKLPPGLDLNEEARRGLSVYATGLGIPTEARISNIRRSPASPPILGNLVVYDIDVQVRQVFPVNSGAKVDDDLRDSLAAIAASSADVVAQALSYPGNLTTTQAGDATNLISGCLAYDSSDYQWRGAVDEAGGSLEAVHRFRGVVKSAPATS